MVKPKTGKVGERVAGKEPEAGFHPVEEKENLGRNHRAIWSLADIKFVESNYGVIPTTKIAETLGRTLEAVRQVVRERGQRLMDPYRPWTEEEKNIISTHFATGDSIIQIMKLLPGRTRGVIYLMKDKLDARSIRRWSEQERQIQEQYYPAEGIAVADRLPGRTKVAVRQTAYAMGLSLKNSEVRSVQNWSKEELQRLEAHQYLPLNKLAALFPERSQQSVRKARIRLEKRQKK
ncbi:hypothetical protein Q2V57_09230 [Enterobacter bugandensis]|uniref:hypothetical protein n=1 Tax=Enterobacter bugandensis TaxID=881260 RepID=UPI002665F82A|nr:hypothetical protein [Enterobacter bugandensis]MDO2431747.1 hypothetical protein [Enterobacter bugandensis]MDO2444793.1 hypothetical protein [Enterobacter bugandensis]